MLIDLSEMSQEYTIYYYKILCLFYHIETLGKDLVTESRG